LLAIRRQPQAANARLLAAQAILAVIRGGRALDTVVESAVDASHPRDPSLVQEMAYGTVRWYYQLNAIACQLQRQPLKRKDWDVLTLILVGLYQLQHMRVPAHAAVAETVAAVGGLGKPWAKAMVNAVLRRFQRERGAIMTRLKGDPEAVTAHPAWLLEAIQAAWPDHWQAIVTANNARAPMALRVNLCAGTREQYLDRLRAGGMAACAGRYVDCGIVLAQPVPVAKLPGFAAGRVSVQDLAAQHAASLLNLAPGQRVLDACAAPGGKSGHILERQPEVAEFVALDIDDRRLDRLRCNLHRLGVTATVVNGDATRPKTWWDGRPFDRILLDAPCSGTGVIRRHPDIKLLRRPADIGKLAVRQTQLLDALWPLLAVGGRLVYVTCSILPEENEARITHFLETHQDAREDLPAMPCGLERSAGRQILPGEDGMDGFYYACIQKLERIGDVG